MGNRRKFVGNRRMSVGDRRNLVGDRRRPADISTGSARLSDEGGLVGDRRPTTKMCDKNYDSSARGVWSSIAAEFSARRFMISTGPFLPSVSAMS